MNIAILVHHQMLTLMLHAITFKPMTYVLINTRDEENYILHIADIHSGTVEKFKDHPSTFEAASQHPHRRTTRRMMML